MKPASMLLLLSLFLFACERENRAKNFSGKVTPESILRIELGMDKQKVVSILGEPFEKSCDACEASCFTYTKPETINYPMIWIGFENQKVSSVMVKYYHVLDDRGVYGLSFDQRTGEVHQWGQAALKEFIK